MYRVVVDPERCSGHARCWTLAPELFPLDDDGYSAYRGLDGATLTADPDVVQRAVAGCPEGAIRAEEVAAAAG
jgi:ferredoxin